jgi:hypothetical protein
MGISERIKKWLEKLIVSPFFLVFGALVVFTLGTMFGMGYLRYYVDGESINRRAVHAHLVLNLWENPQFLPGELNLLKGNQEATLSEDGKTKIVTRSFSRDNTDLYISELGEKGWSKPVALSGFINTGYDERGPSLSRDGNWLVFQSNRPDTIGGYDLYISQRVGDRWSEPTNLGPGINTVADEAYGIIANDGQTLFFSSNRIPGKTTAVGERETKEDWDIYQACLVEEGSVTDQLLPVYGTPEPVSVINTDANETHAAVPNGSNFLYFASDREDGLGGYDIWVSRFFDGQYIEPENLGKPVNSHLDEMYPTFSERGKTLHFVSNVYSFHPQALKYYSSRSKQVLSRFDYDLLRNVILVILLMVLAGYAIHYLLKFLLDSELKLLPRCLIASFLLHLILAALTGSLFITSKIEETLSQNLQEMTVNMNALARESISVAIRESVASLPKVEAPSALEQLEIEVPLKVETPVNQSVNPYPDRVRVEQTAVSPQQITQVRQAPSRIEAASTKQMVAKMNFSDSNLMMETPEGIIQSGEGEAIDPNADPKPQDAVEEPFESRRLVENRLEGDSFDPLDALQGQIQDTITQAVQSGSIGEASRSKLSGNLSSQIKKGIRDSLSEDNDLELATSSPTSLALGEESGALLFEPMFVMEVVKEDEEEEDQEFLDFLSLTSERMNYMRKFGFDLQFAKQPRVAPSGTLGELYTFEEFRRVSRKDDEDELSEATDMLKANVPMLDMDADTELEIPEYMLEDLESSESIRPVF